MTTHIIQDGVVVNNIIATVSEAQSAFPDAVCIEATEGGIGWLWDGESLTPPHVPPEVPTVPDSVTRRQAKQALLLNGLLGNVQPAIDAIPNATQRAMIQIEWDDSQVFERDRPALIALGTALGLSSSGLDALFIQAGAL